MCNCEFFHGTPLTGINNAVDDGPLLLSPTVLDATKAQAPSVWVVVHLLQNCLYNNVNKKSTEWSSGLTVYVCANNRHSCRSLSVFVAMCFKYRLQCVFFWLLHSACSTIFCEAVSHGPSVLADIVVAPRKACLLQIYVNEALHPLTCAVSHTVIEWVSMLSNGDLHRLILLIMMQLTGWNERR